MAFDIMRFYTLDRKTIETLLAKCLSGLDDITLKHAIFSILSTYNPDILKSI